MLAATPRQGAVLPNAAGPLAAAAIGGVALGVLVPALEQGWWVLLALGAVGAVVVVTWSLETGLWAFILATALNRYNFEVAGWQMKIEHMVLLLVLVAWGLRFLAKVERPRRWPFVVLAVALLAWGLAASALQSPDLYKSFRILTRMGLAVASYLLIINYAHDGARLWRLTKVLLAVAAGAAAYGIFAVAAWRVAGANFGLQYSTISGVWHPYGTLWEANIFGAYSMSAALIALVLLVSRQRVISRWFLSMVLGVTAVAMLLSLGRAAWVGFGVGGLLMLLFMSRLRFRSVLAVSLGALLAAVLLTTVDPGGVFGDVWDRAGTLQTASSDINVMSRLSNSALALREWEESRWLGWGIDSFHIRHPEIESALPSPQLNTLYDTGFVGVALFAAFVLAFLARAFIALLASEGRAERDLLLALLFSFLGLLAAYQATDAFWLGFTWVHLALLAGTVLTVESGVRQPGRPAP